MSAQEVFYLQSLFELFEDSDDERKSKVVASLREYGNPEQLIRYIVAKGAPAFFPVDYAMTLFRLIELYILSSDEIEFNAMFEMVEYLSKLCCAIRSSAYFERLDVVYDFVFSNSSADPNYMANEFAVNGENCLIVAHIASLNKTVVNGVMSWMAKNYQDQWIWLHAFTVMFLSEQQLSDEFVLLALGISAKSTLEIEPRAVLLKAVFIYLGEVKYEAQETIETLFSMLTLDSPNSDVLACFDLAVSILNLKRDPKMIEKVITDILPFVHSSDRAFDLIMNKFACHIDKNSISDGQFERISDFARKCIAAKFPTESRTPFVFTKPVERNVLAYFAENTKFPFIYLVPLFENCDIHQFIGLFRYSDEKPRSFWNKIVRFLPFCEDFAKLQYIANVLETTENVPLVIANEMDAAYISVASKIISNPGRNRELLPISEYLRNCKANMEAYRLDRPVDEITPTKDRDSDKPTRIRSPERKRRNSIASPKNRETPVTEESPQTQSSTKRRRLSATLESGEIQMDSDDKRRVTPVKRRPKIPKPPMKPLNLVRRIIQQIESVPAWSSELLAMITTRIDNYDELAASFLPILGTNRELLEAFCPKSDRVRAIFFGNLLSRDVIGVELLGNFLTESGYSEASLATALNGMSMAQRAYPKTDLYENVFVLGLSYESLRQLSCQTILMTCNMLGNHSIDFRMLLLKLLEIGNERYDDVIASVLRVSNEISNMTRIVDAVMMKPTLETALLSNWEESRQVFFDMVEKRLDSDPLAYDMIVRNREFVPSLKYLGPVCLRVSRDNFSELESSIETVDSESALCALRNVLREFDWHKKKELKRFCWFVPLLVEKIDEPGKIIPEYVEKFSCVNEWKELEFIQVVIEIARRNFRFCYQQLRISKKCHFLKSIVKHICQLTEFKCDCIRCLENEFYRDSPNLSFGFLFMENFVQFQLEENDVSAVATLLVLICRSFLFVSSDKDVKGLSKSLSSLSSRIGIPLGDTGIEFQFEAACKSLVRNFHLLDKCIVHEFLTKLQKHANRIDKLSSLFGYLSVVLGKDSENGREAASVYLEHTQTLMPKSFTSSIDIAWLNDSLQTKLLRMVLRDGSLIEFSKVVIFCREGVLVPFANEIIERCSKKLFCDEILDVVDALTRMNSLKEILMSNQEFMEKLVPVVIEKPEKIIKILSRMFESDIFANVLDYGIVKFHTLDFYEHVVYASFNALPSTPRLEHFLQLFNVIEPCLTLNHAPFLTIKDQFIQTLKSQAETSTAQILLNRLNGKETKNDDELIIPTCL